MSRVHLINIFINSFVYIFPLTQNTSSKPKDSVSNNYYLDSASTLSQCIIAGPPKPPWFTLGVRQLSLKLPTTMDIGEARARSTKNKI